MQGGGVILNRQEIANRMRESIIDYDKELIIKTVHAMRKNILNFIKNEVGLKGEYPEISFKYEGEGCHLKYKENSLILEFLADQKKIVVIKETTTNEKVIDEIVAKNKSLMCNDGEFKTEEIDEYLSRCFAKLLK
jgi:hypothetical protein